MLQATHRNSKMASSSPSEMAKPIVSIVFHGNCIDGWFSAYIAQGRYAMTHTIRYYPISPNLSHTWPTAEQIANTDVLMCDVSVPEKTLTKWDASARSIFCIDHHATSESQWKNPKREHQCVHSTDACATLLAWNYYMPLSVPIPEWVHQIDRIDRWHKVTDDDRAVREHLYTIARLPVQGNIDEAMRLTNEFVLACTLYPVIPAPLDAMKARGVEMLREKEAATNAILRMGKVVTITSVICSAWCLSPEWIGTRGFIIDTTGIVLDSTEAGHIAMRDYKTHFFVNYRVKEYINSDGVPTKTYIYSARSKDGYDLTAGGSILAGHPCSAGASVTIQDDAAIPPFVLDT